MERLTQDTINGASLLLDNPKTDYEAREQIKEKFKNACNRLAEYEKTGLSPEEVKELKAKIADVEQYCNEMIEDAEKGLDIYDFPEGRWKASVGILRRLKGANE